MKLTVGMATHNDFYGVWPTVQDARMKLERVLGSDTARREVEFVIVDNDPRGAHGQANRDFAAKAGARWLPYHDVIGTAAPRHRVFEEARGDWVICLDSHVLVYESGWAALLRYIDQFPHSDNLLQGPLVDDTFTGLSTHFNDFWRGRMWGIWGCGWQKADGSGPRFSVVAEDGEAGGKAVWLSLDLADTVELTYGRQRPIELPDVELIGCRYAGHERHLQAAGYRQLIDDDDVFAIPAQGLGLFAMRREAWAGFNPHFAGFGGEEFYLHEKVRRLGAEALCLGGLKWVHRFGRPDGYRYPNTDYRKVRNYVLGLQENGQSLDRLRSHFVPLWVSEAHWQYLLADPIGRATEPGQAAPSRPIAEELLAPQRLTALAGSAAEDRELPASAAPQLPDELEQTYRRFAATPRDLDQHAELLRSHAAGCQHVTEISKRRESTIFLAAGRPSRLVSYNTEGDDPALRRLQECAGGAVWIAKADSTQVAEINETDLLFIDSQHTYARLTDELTRFGGRVRREIILRGTVGNGETGEDGEDGLAYAIRDWLRQHPEWFVAQHVPAQYGMTVLAKQGGRPEPAIRFWPLGFGPGTELKNLLLGLNIQAKKDCPCKRLMHKMDELGPAGCREDRAIILGEFHQTAKLYGWSAAIHAGWKSVVNGLWWKLLSPDPLGALVDEAIRRAEAHQKVQAAA